jgi:radical SAM superfamily enzyme YgiQ (UPF0313 family)
MKILFLRPLNQHIVFYDTPKNIEESSGHINQPPLGLLYVAACAERGTDCEIAVLDGVAEGITDYSVLEARIREIDPDLVAVQSMTTAFLDTVLTVRCVKRIRGDIPVAVGGIHPTIYPEETLAVPEIDYVFQGEAEVSFVEFLKHFGDKEALAHIKGLAFERDGAVVNTGRSDEIRDLDDLPFPARHLTPVHAYQFSLMESPFTTIITSRGCPYKCTFCDRAFLSNGYRTRSAKGVVDEMEHCHREYGIRNFYFQDDTFTVRKRHVREFCEEIKARNCQFKWAARSRVDFVDAELLAAMKEAGCQRLDVGVESGSQETLDRTQKSSSVGLSEAFLRTTREVGMDTLGYYMMGFPDESKQQIQQTVDLSLKMNPSYALFLKFLCLPATKIYEDAVRDGFIDDYWRKFAKAPTDDFFPKRWNSAYTAEDLDAVIAKAYRRFYLRPSYLLKQLLAIRTLDQVVMQVKVALTIVKTWLKTSSGEPPTHPLFEETSELPRTVESRH